MRTHYKIAWGQQFYVVCNATYNSHGATTQLDLVTCYRCRASKKFIEAMETERANMPARNAFLEFLRITNEVAEDQELCAQYEDFLASPAITEFLSSLGITEIPKREETFDITLKTSFGDNHIEAKAPSREDMIARIAANPEQFLYII